MIHDIELERSIIATVNHDSYSKEIIANIVRPEYFYHPSYRKQYEDVLQGIPVECDIRESMPYNQEYYALALKEMHRRREVIKQAGLIQSMAESDDMGDIEAKIEELQADLISESNNNPLTISEIEAIENEKGVFTKLECDFDYNGFYDKAGSHKGQTEVIFGHPKHGKTSYCIHRCCEYLKKGYKGLYITMEASYIDIKNKILAQLGSNTDFRDNVLIADRSLGARELQTITNMIKSSKIRHNLDFVAVDYLQRIPVKGLSPKDEVQRVMEVSNRLTDIANEYNLFLFLLAQPHRIDKMRRGWNTMPEVYNLYGSGAIEKDAFVATAVFRPGLIEELMVRDGNGYVVNALDFMNNPVHVNSVYACQKINRESERVSHLLHMVHTDNGLSRETNVKEVPF